VVTVDGEIDLSTADGEFRATVIAALARFEVRRKGEMSIRAPTDRVARRGLPVAGKRRYGFQPGNIVELPEEADRVRKAYRVANADRYQRGFHHGRADGQLQRNNNLHDTDPATQHWCRARGANAVGWGAWPYALSAMTESGVYISISGVGVPVPVLVSNGTTWTAIAPLVSNGTIWLSAA